MSNQESHEKKRFGLSEAEFDNLKDMLRYGAIIVGTVAVTFVIVALVSRAVGF